MNKNKMMSCLLVLNTLCIVSENVFAGQFVTMGLKGGQAELGAMNASLEQEGHHVSVLNARAGLFESNHSYVQLYHPEANSGSVKVANRDVAIAFPGQLTSDSLMEGLLKIQAAKTYGANEVIVYHSGAQPLQIEDSNAANCLNFEELIAAAGADVLNENGEAKALSPNKRIKNKVSKPDFWIGGSSHPELMAEIAQTLGKRPVSFAAIQQNGAELKGRKIYWVSANQPWVNPMFFETLGEIRWMQQQGAVVHLIAPYLPYARSDKPDFKVGETAQGRLAADLIEAVGTHGITVVRAHAPQSMGFFKIHAQDISGRPTIENFLKDSGIEAVVSPDAGFQKDATKYQQELNKIYGGAKNVTLTVMNKERKDGKEGILGGTGLENVRGRNVVIIDDETATGGTLGKVAEALQAYQPKSIFAVVTHLAGPAKGSLNSPYISKLVVTNTVPLSLEALQNPKLKVLSIASEIAEGIRKSENN